MLQGKIGEEERRRTWKRIGRMRERGEENKDSLVIKSDKRVYLHD